MSDNDNGKMLKKLDNVANIISKIGFPIVVTGFLLWVNFTTGKDILETLQRIETKIDQIRFKAIETPEYKNDNNKAIQIKLNNKLFKIKSL